MILTLFLLAVGAMALAVAVSTSVRGLRERLEQEQTRRLQLEWRVERLERSRSDGERGAPAETGATEPVVEATFHPAAAGAAAPWIPEPVAMEPAGFPGTVEFPPVLARVEHAMAEESGVPEETPLRSPAVPAGAGAGGPAGAVAGLDLERFMGVRLFAWLGGLALFLAVAYFVKYSFERNLIPPAARVLIGLAMGVGLTVGGVRLRLEAYRVTAQTLCATGVVVMYASLFAGHALYQLPWLGSGMTFALMSGVTATAFLLAVRMPALVVAVLGMLGGFLTPVLLSTGQDQPGALFTYLALLDAGLVAVALCRGWRFLPALGAASTVVLQLGWAGRFFAPDRTGLALVIFGGFIALFLAGFAVARRRGEADGWWGAAVGVAAFGTLLLAGWMLGMPELVERPLTVFLFVLIADLALLAVAWWLERLAGMHAAAGLLAFGYLAAWMGRSLTPALLGEALGLSFVFAALHAGYPLVLQHFKPGPRRMGLAQVFPPLGLTVLMIPLLKLETPSFGVWPVILLVNLLALALAAWGAGVVGAVVALLLSGLATSLWIGRQPSDLGDLGSTLLIIGATATLFTVAGVGILRRGSGADGVAAPEGRSGFGVLGGTGEDALRAQLPVVAVLMPFLLLAQVVVHVPLPEPSAVFAVAALMVALLLGLTLWVRNGLLPLMGLAGLALVEHVWWLDELPGAARPGWVVAWFVALHLGFVTFPVLFRERLGRLTLPWIAAAMSGLPQYHLVHRVLERHWALELPGLVPVLFGVPVAGVFAWLLRSMPADHPERTRRLAWFGGMTLFFLTVALPVQFERNTLTVGLALEGAALLALFRRVPHPGLRLTGVGLLVVVFARLGLSPFLMEGVVRGSLPLFNAWLYTYGLAVAAMFGGAWLLKPGTETVLGANARQVLATLGTLLLFGLLNLEIADFFTPVGEWVRFEFTGHFGRDMTYTIAWALFALGLVATGLARRVVAARWSGLGLLAFATAKLFLHDLARLDQLYRIGALAGVALIAIAASVLYQRFVAREETGR